MSNIKQQRKLNKQLLITAAGIYLLFIGCGIVNSLIVQDDKPEKSKTGVCKINTLCAGHSTQEHLKWDREGRKLAFECWKNNYKCHPNRD